MFSGKHLGWHACICSYDDHFICIHMLHTYRGNTFAYSYIPVRMYHVTDTWHHNIHTGRPTEPTVGTGKLEVAREGKANTEGRIAVLASICGMVLPCGFTVPWRFREEITQRRSLINLGHHGILRTGMYS